MKWEAFCKGYAAPKTFAEALYLYDLWSQRNGGMRRKDLSL